MAKLFSKELRRLVQSDKNTRITDTEIDRIAQRIADTATVCSLTLRRAIEVAAPGARVSDDFVEDAAAQLQASASLR